MADARDGWGDYPPDWEEIREHFQFVEEMTREREDRLGVRQVVAKCDLIKECGG